MPHGRIYLDNAATSFPKPARVMEAMAAYASDLGASPGRGTYAESIESGRLLRVCRERICRLVGAGAPERVAFTLNATDALNLAIKGLVRGRLRRDPARPIHAVTTATDHNSVLRPLNALRAEGLEWTCVPCDPETGRVDPDDVANAIRPDTALVALCHASNVTGTVQPLAEIGAACRRAGVPLVVDAAQSLGHMPVDVEAMGVDLLAFPGHKGLLGPLGTGGLWIRPGLEDRVEPLREGGTGSVSERDVQPETMPDRYESGSHNTIGLVGLSEGVAYLLQRGVEAVREHERALARRVHERLADAPGLRIVGPGEADERTAVFSIVHKSLGPAELAMLLEQHAGVLVRAGIHCAPRAHEALGTLHAGGTTRLSAGPFTTTGDIDAACDAIAGICRDASAPC